MVGKMLDDEWMDVRVVGWMDRWRMDGWMEPLDKKFT